MPSMFGSPPPSAPGYRAPGGIATDIAGGVNAFVQSVQGQRDRAALEAFRRAQQKLAEDKLTQDAEQGGLDRDLKKYLGELQAEVERERNERIRRDQDRDRSSAIEVATRDLRREFQHQLGERGKQGMLARQRELEAKDPNAMTDAERMELYGFQTGKGKAAPSTHADSLVALEAATSTATGPLSSEAADRLRQALGLDRPLPPQDDTAKQAQLQRLAEQYKEALARGVDRAQAQQVLLRERAKILGTNE